MTTSTSEAGATTAEDGDGGRRPGRRLWWVIGVGVGVLLLLYAAAGWYLSGRIIDGLTVTAAEATYDTDVVSVADGEIEVVPPDSADATADVDAVTGLRWDGGYARVGPATAVDGDVQTRAFELLAGAPPVPGADVAQFHAYAFPPDPAAAGLAVESVSYPTNDGELDAWFLPGDDDTWIVAVHGRGEDRAEMLRMVDATKDLGHPTLVVTYRNDVGAPSSRDGVVMVGQEEWEDVDAAVDHALANGASGVVLYGNSMGGALSLATAMNDDTGAVRALVLDAPTSDFREVVRFRSGEALPIGGPVGDSLLAAGRLFTWLRTGLDFDTIDYVDRADELDVPVLLFHGVDDPSMPFTSSEELAAARPDLVEFHPVEDATHVRAWNEDPEGYADVVADFLAGLDDG